MSRKNSNARKATVNITIDGKAGTHSLRQFAADHGFPVPVGRGRPSLELMNAAEAHYGSQYVTKAGSVGLARVPSRLPVQFIGTDKLGGQHMTDREVRSLLASNGATVGTRGSLTAAQRQTAGDLLAAPIVAKRQAAQAKAKATRKAKAQPVQTDLEVTVPESPVGSF